MYVLSSVVAIAFGRALMNPPLFSSSVALFRITLDWLRVVGRVKSAL